MKLARYGVPGKERPAVIDAEGLPRDVSGIIQDWSGSGLSDASMNGLAEINLSKLPTISPDTRIGSPIADPSKIICIGLNYVDHAKEAGLPTPAEPIVFLKGCRPTGPNDDVYLPRGSAKGDWEVELGIVIGKPGIYIPEASAKDHVLGYTLVNDLSEREYQMERGGQWTKGKSFPGFAPIGPFIATRDEIPNPEKLPIWLDVNGHRYQDSSTSNLIFGIDKIVSYVSSFFQLEAGDIIATGTPPGVGLGIKPTPVFLKAGDRIELGIEGLGRQRQKVHAWKE